MAGIRHDPDGISTYGKYRGEKEDFSTDRERRKRDRRSRKPYRPQVDVKTARPPSANSNGKTTSPVSPVRRRKKTRNGDKEL